MKKLIAVSAIASALFAIATPASAICVVGCGTPAPTPSPNLNFTVTAAALTSGLGASEAVGQMTSTAAGQEGLSSALVSLVGSGNGCGSKCANIGWAAAVLANQTANSSGLAASFGPGNSVAGVLGSTSAIAGANITIKKK